MITISEHRFMIEHYQQVLFLSDIKIVIKLKKQTVEINGSSIILDYYSHVEIRGHGNIDTVRFL